MHESVISISSLIEICQTKAIASGFKKGHQRTCGIPLILQTLLITQWTSLELKAA